MNQEKNNNEELQAEESVQPLGATLTESSCCSDASDIDKKKDTATASPGGIDVDAEI